MTTNPVTTVALTQFLAIPDAFPDVLDDSEGPWGDLTIVTAPRFPESPTPEATDPGRPRLTRAEINRYVDIVHLLVQAGDPLREATELVDECCGW